MCIEEMGKTGADARRGGRTGGGNGKESASTLREVPSID